MGNQNTGFKPHTIVCENLPPLTGSDDIEASPLAPNSYKKLMFRSNGSFNSNTCRDKLTSSTKLAYETLILLAVLHIGLLNHNKTGHLLRRKCVLNHASMETRKPRQQFCQIYVRITLSNETKMTASIQLIAMCVLSKPNKQLKYVIGWYRYSPEDDIIKPPSHIPQHFTTRYWRRVKRDQARKTNSLHHIQRSNTEKAPSNLQSKRAHENYSI